jgi:hypothetical protein
MRRSALSSLALIAFAILLLSGEPPRDSRLGKAFRNPAKNGWTLVHLEGSPSQIGFQHGFLLAPEIQNAQRVLALESQHDSKRAWTFFRNTAKNVFWPHIEREYREELKGIADGLNARGIKLDVWDVVAMNASQEVGGYVGLVDHGLAKPPEAPGQGEHCSAFVATGSYTKDRHVVIGHNNWTSYLEGERWNIVFDITPAKGYRILMDGFPGYIDSADDFGMNSGGIMITETTITQFSGFDPNGIPEFVRARKAMQYSSSIDDFARIMKEGNNGGYANNWLVADRNTDEIGSLELGLKNVNLWRTKDGYFAGNNRPVDPKLAQEETSFPMDDLSLSPNARKLRWEQLLAQYKGKIDVSAGQRFLADHYDTYTKKSDPNERTLCGHIDLSPRGCKPWQVEYAAAGTVQAKVADAAMGRRMAISVSMGHPCGIHFKAADHIRKHPEFDWQSGLLRDMNSTPWTEFRATP